MSSLFNDDDDVRPCVLRFNTSSGEERDIPPRQVYFELRVNSVTCLSLKLCLYSI